MMSRVSHADCFILLHTGIQAGSYSEARAMVEDTDHVVTWKCNAEFGTPLVDTLGLLLLPCVNHPAMNA